MTNKEIEQRFLLMEKEINELRKENIKSMKELTHCVQSLMNCFRLLDKQLNGSPAEREVLFNEIDPEYMQKYYEVKKGTSKTIYMEKDKDGNLVKVNRSNFCELVKP